MDDDVWDELNSEILAELNKSPAAMNAAQLYAACGTAETRATLNEALSDLVQEGDVVRCGAGGGLYRPAGVEKTVPPSPMKGRKRSGAPVPRKAGTQTKAASKGPGQAPAAAPPLPLPTVPSTPVPDLALIEFQWRDIEYRVSGPAQAVVAGFGHFCAELFGEQ